MNKEENHIIIEVLNSNGDLKLTKFRNPQAIWQKNDYPDEYVFRDVDIVNVFKLIQENKQLKERMNKAIEVLEKGITFCENDSQGIYDKCNIVINREKKVLETLKGDSNE